MKLNVVPGRVGLNWFREGLRTFWRQPLAMAGLFFMYLAVVSLVGLIPYLGVVLSLALLPAATLGMMAATREAAQGRFPMPSILLSALRAGRERARHMAVLGALYATGFLLVLAISALMDGGQFARLTLLGGTLTPELVESGSFVGAALLAMILYVPFSMLFWYAPALVHWHNLPPLQSLFYSGVASTRNFWALTLYTLAWSGLFFGISLVVMLIAVTFGSPALMVNLTFPVAMLMAAMFFTSIWFTFRDSFIATTPDAAASTVEEPGSPPL